MMRGGEYDERGDYHRSLDPNWSYYPIYIRKMEWIERYVDQRCSENDLILDAGCGEGALVEKLSASGYNIFGVDRDYGSPLVHRADLGRLPFQDETFDLVLCLDVLEHIDVLQQHLAVDELDRVLKKHGRIVFSLPNLAHLESRWSFVRRGALVRTARLEKHPGDRPWSEYLNFIEGAGLKLVRAEGIKLTLPRLIRNLLGRSVSERVMFSSRARPSLCFLVIAEFEKLGTR